MALKIAAFCFKITYNVCPRASGSEPEEPTIFYTKKSWINTKNALKKSQKTTLKIAAVLLKNTYIGFPRASGSEPEEPTIFYTKKSKENA